MAVCKCKDIQKATTRQKYKRQNKQILNNTVYSYNVSLFMCIFQSESFKDWFSCDKKMVFMQLKTAALGFVYQFCWFMT